MKKHAFLSCLLASMFGLETHSIQTLKKPLPAVAGCNEALNPYQKKAPPRLQSRQELRQQAYRELLPALAASQPEGILTSKALQKMPIDHPIIESILRKTLGFSMAGGSIYNDLTHRLHSRAGWKGICKIYGIPVFEKRIEGWVYFQFLAHVWEKWGNISTTNILSVQKEDPLITNIFGSHSIDGRTILKRLKSFFPTRTDMSAFLNGLFKSQNGSTLLKQDPKLLFFIFEVITSLKDEGPYEGDGHLTDFPEEQYAPFILMVIEKWQKTGKSLEDFPKEPVTNREWLKLTLFELITGSESDEFQIDYTSSEEDLAAAIEKRVKSPWFWRQ